MYSKKLSLGLLWSFHQVFISLIINYIVLGGSSLRAQSSSSQQKALPCQWKTATSVGYPYRYVTNDPMQTRFYTLKNGLTVILSVNRKEPRVLAYIAIRSGSNNDPKNNTGLAHYLEHLLFKGTDRFGTLDWSKEKPLLDQVDTLYEKYNKTTDTIQRKAIYKEIDRVSGEAAKYAIANEYDKMMSGLGSQATNAFTWCERTYYVEDIPSNGIDRFLTVQAERFRKPVLRLFHTELEAVYEEKNRALDNDDWKVWEGIHAALFPTHNYGQQTTIGTVEHLKNPSLMEIRKYYDTHYVPNNMAVILSGDFNPDEVIRKIDQKLGYMQPKPLQEYKPAPEVPLTSVQTREVFGPTPERLMIGFRLPSALDKNKLVLATVANALMANDAAGLIDLDLNKQQKILNGWSLLSLMKDYSAWFLSGRPKQGQALEEVKSLLLAEVEKLKKGQFDETLIPSIVANHKKEYLLDLEKNDSRAYLLLQTFTQTRGESWVDRCRQLDDMARVTKQQVIDFANQYFKDNYVVLYKRKGIDNTIRKIDKPTITPIEVNRNDQSPFLQQVNAMPIPDIKPLWLDFQRDFQRRKVGSPEGASADILYIKNTDNQLFRLGYRIQLGYARSKLLPIAIQYLEYLGTNTLSTEEISRAFYNLACSYQITYTKEEYTTVQLSGLQENFSKSVQLLEHVLRNCKPDEQALEALKGRILKSRTDNKLNKKVILDGLVNYALYGPNNPFNHQLSNDELKAITSAQLIDVLHQLLNYPQQIIYFGPQSLTDFSQQITLLHPLPAAYHTLPPRTEFKQIAQTHNQVLFTDYDMVQAEITWIRNTGAFNPAQLPVIDLFNNYFGGSMSSIVFQTLRESKALAYETYAYQYTPDRKDQQFWLRAYIGSQADKFHEAITGMNELLHELPESPKLLETSKTSLKKILQTDRIRQDDIIYTYLEAQEKGLDYDTRQKTYEALDKLHYADLKQFAQQNLANQPYTYCVLASEKRVSSEDLAKYGTLKKLTLEEIFGY